MVPPDLGCVDWVNLLGMELKNYLLLDLCGKSLQKTYLKPGHEAFKFLAVISETRNPGKAFYLQILDCSTNIRMFGA